MKPIRLTLAGLQSYREKQEVDFERLCEGGVFGIFGPTGSGKSTILDAMTLALYGKVERASKGTQGILNQAENTLSVAFTFELSGAEGTKRFRVERGFKRTGDASVTCHLCRFIEIRPEGDTVLADKLVDVNRCVEERIGLTMDDFTRAVVLPQGKFAEFLSLAGKDRRQMLQRLFALERYGDGLLQRLSQRAQETGAALARTAAEQQGLGDASEAAREAAAEARRQAAEAARLARAELAAAEDAHAALRQVREREEERRALAARREALLADAPRIAQLEAELARLEQAERMKPALEAWDEARRGRRDAEARHAEAEREHAVRKEAAAAAEAAWAEAEREAAEAEPRMAARLEQLAQAEAMEREAAAIAEEAEEGRRRLAEAGERMRVCEAQAEKAADLLRRAAARQQELREQLRGVELTPEERGSWMAAAARAEQLRAAAARRDEAERELSQAEQALSRAREAARESERRRAVLAQQAEALLERAAESFRRLSGLEADIRREAERLPALTAALRERVREAERRQLAARLAETLEDGRPCPVCGALDHPRPHAPETGGSGEDGREAEALVRRGERLADELGGLRLSAAALLRQAGQTVRALAEAAGLLSARPAEGASAASGEVASVLREAAATIDDGEHAAILREAAAGAATDIEPASDTAAGAGSAGATRAEADGGAAAAALEAAAARASEARRLAGQCEAEWRGLAREAEELARGLAEADRACSRAAAEADASASACEAVRMRHREADDACRAQLEAWRSRFPALDPKDADAAIREWERRDREAQEIRQALERSVPFVEEQQKLAQEAERGMHEARLEREVWRERLEGRSRALEDLRARLAAWTGGRPAAELIAEIRRDAEALRARLAESRRRRETEAALLQQAAERRASAAEAAQSAAARAQEAERRLEEQLRASDFLDAEEARAALEALPRKAATAAEIEAHREAMRQIEAGIAHIVEVLRGRSVSDEDWRAGEERLAAAKARAEEALAAAAKAERDLEELERKAARWAELESRRRELEELAGRYAKLQTVFRGNAFVEFVAEAQLEQVCRAASERLGFLTKRRYALELDSAGGFVVRDDASGGMRRPVSTLSGGETFLASLALALALSGQIQLRGRHPLQFFFLDEGFGTLDPELLDTVVTALERLHTDNLAVGVISHVPELRARLPRRLIVEPADPAGSGSRVRLETL
jgi:exonuclease SbcC